MGQRKLWKGEWAMSGENTREVINKWIDSQHTDTSILADDVVFTSMNTAEEDRGPEGVLGSLTYIYHVAFDARFELRNLIVDGGIGVAEADFVGEHIGEFAGIRPTHKHVRVPLCVVYEVDDEKILISAQTSKPRILVALCNRG
jgi:predicted ester cyclase